MATLNIGIKINRAITGATTVNANSMAIVTYVCNAIAQTSISPDNTPVGVTFPPVTRFFGPSQSVPVSFTTVGHEKYASSGANQGTINLYSTATATYTLQSGVELTNT